MRTRNPDWSYAWLSCLAALAACSNEPIQPKNASAMSSLAAEGGGGGFGDPAPDFDVAYTERIGQLTGTAQNPLKPVGMVGTDLGISFQRGDELIFLFGDSWVEPAFSEGFQPNPDWNLDSVASTSAARPEATPKLDWYRRADETSPFRPFVVKKAGSEELHPMGEMSVPVEGIAGDGFNYLFFHVTPIVFDDVTQTTSHLPAISLVAEANDDFSRITTRHEEVRTRFKSVSTVRLGDDVYIYGAEVYRMSAVYLAKAPFNTLGDRSTWEYYNGDPDPKTFVAAETGVAVVDENCVGELSVRKHPTDELYFMTYNCGSRVRHADTNDFVDGYPHEIRLRTARHPAGPWSKEAIVLLEKHAGDGHFVRGPGPFDPDGGPKGEYDDGLQGAYNDPEPGDVYGPYLIPQWFNDPQPGVHEIVYTLSTWNPYQVHLMRTVLTDPGVTVTRPTPSAMEPSELANANFANGIAGWTQTGDVFGTNFDLSGEWAITTLVATKGEDGIDVDKESGLAKGSLSQEFYVGAKSTLSFKVYGGDGEVTLKLGDEIVRRAKGRGTGEVVPVRWNLASLRGKKVQLEIRDDAIGNWGYVTVTPFTLE